MSDGLVFILTALAAYRIFRFWKLDTLPPVRWVRDKFDAAVEARFGVEWADGVTCPWCMGAHVSFLTVGAVWYFRPLPLPALWFGAVSTIVGFLSQRDEG